MMKKIILSLILLIVILASISSVQATTYLNIYLDDKGNALLLGQTTETDLSLPLGVSLQEGKIIGNTKALISKKGGIWTFSFSLNNSDMEVIVPSNFIIKNLSDSEISYKGETISIFAKDSINLSYQVPSFNYFLTSITILIFLILAYAIYTKKKKNKKEQPKNKNKKEDKDKIIIKLLNDRENLIIQTLKKLGKIKISHLRKITEIPKASLSRHIQQLEKKHLIKRSGEGKNKFVQSI